VSSGSRFSRENDASSSGGRVAETRAYGDHAEALTSASESAQQSGAVGEMRVAVLAAPGQRPAVVRDVADVVAERLEALRDGAPARVEVVEDPVLSAPAATVELVEALRQRLLEEDWALVVGLTDLPLRLARRPVAGHASPMHGVALLSVPALGVARTAQRARAAVSHLLDVVLGEHSDEPAGGGRSVRLRRRLAGLQKVHDERGGWSAVIAGGYLRLLAGLVWANEPWRFAARLSRALVAALAAVAFALVTPDLWQLAGELSPGRLSALTVASIAASTAGLIVVHRLWEQTARRSARAQIALFNLATAATVLLGVSTLYLALFVITAASAALLLPGHVLADAIGHPVGVRDYLQLSWLVSSLATIGGGLGGGLESEASVREAAYAADAEDDAV
jgi:hypothetical protein